MPHGSDTATEHLEAATSRDRKRRCAAKHRETPDSTDPFAAIGSRQLAGWVRGLIRPVVNATMSTIEGM
jgi:hypothetical protein